MREDMSCHYLHSRLFLCEPPQQTWRYNHSISITLRLALQWLVQLSPSSLLSTRRLCWPPFSALTNATHLNLAQSSPLGEKNQTSLNDDYVKLSILPVKTMLLCTGVDCWTRGSCRISESSIWWPGAAVRDRATDVAGGLGSWK